MNQTEVEKALNGANSMADYEILFKEAKENQSFFLTVWEIANEKEDNEAWRLLWILDHATEKKNTFIFSILDSLYQKVLATENESYLRQAMKLILRCPISEEYVGEMLNRCVYWFNNPKAKVSSQVLPLEFFFKACKVYPEMAPELLAYINDMQERTTSAGVKFRLRQIRNELEIR